MSRRSTEVASRGTFRTRSIRSLTKPSSSSASITWLPSLNEWEEHARHPSDVELLTHGMPYFIVELKNFIKILWSKWCTTLDGRKRKNVPGWYRSPTAEGFFSYFENRTQEKVFFDWHESIITVQDIPLARFLLRCLLRHFTELQFTITISIKYMQLETRKKDEMEGWQRRHAKLILRRCSTVFTYDSVCVFD